MMRQIEEEIEEATKELSPSSANNELVQVLDSCMASSCCIASQILTRYQPCFAHKATVCFRWLSGLS
jgi:hypothetical protein